MKKLTHTKKPVHVSDDIHFDTERDVVSKEKKSVRPLVVVVSLLVIAGLVVVGFMKRNTDRMNTMKTKTIPSIVKKVDPGVTVKSVNNLKEVSDLYQFELELDINGQVQKFTSYTTKDGQLFFTGGVKVAELDKKEVLGDTTSGGEAKKLTCDDLKKTQTPSVTAFVVSQCPYGLQMQRVMKMAIGEEGQLNQSLNVKYIGAIENGKITSMHGDKEAQENLRQICIREEQKDLYWPYVSCYMQEGKGDECATKTGVNTASLQSCVTDASKGLAYAKKDFDIADTYKIGSSPTLLVNDQIVSEFDFGGRTSNALKDIVCCSSSAKAGFCGKELSKTDAAVAFSVKDVGEVAGAAAANCATQ